jgi:hypothetical protein
MEGGKFGEKPAPRQGQHNNIKDKISSIQETKQQFFKRDELKFEWVVSTIKHCIIGAKGGYLLVFEKTLKNALKFLGKVRLSDRYISIKSLELNPKEDTIVITVVCPYKIEELGSGEGDALDQPMKFAPPESKVKGKSGHTFLFTHQK